MKTAAYLLAVVSLIAILFVVNDLREDAINVASGDDETTSGPLNEGVLSSVDASLKYVLDQRKTPKIPLKNIFFDSSKYQADRYANEKHAPTTENTKIIKENKIITIPHLVGIVIRRNEAKALFVDGEQSYSLKKGDSLAGRYRIQSISSDKVKIIDISSKLNRTIYIMDE